MSSFASLMAISASHTKESQQVVANALRERREKEMLQRKQQEEKEAREREQEKKLRLRRLEEEKRNQERLQRLEGERKAKEAALQRREDEQRDSLRYGPKKAAKLAGGSSNGGGPKWPSSSSDAREEVRRRRMPDDSEQEGGVVLTREELRERKQQAEMRKLFSASKRSSTASRGYGKSAMRLPGGAVNIVTNQGGKQADEQANVTGGSVKDRLASKPNTLVQLNMKKRDKRTEDEIQMEVRANKKVLDGSDALQFTDWFSDKKKDKTPAKASPGPAVSSSPPSRADTPASRIAHSSASTSAPSSQKYDSRPSKPVATKHAPSALHKSTSGTSRASSSDAHTSSLAHSKFPKINKNSSTATSSQRPSSSANSGQKFKRPRSPSLSDSPPPPPKKRSTHHEPAEMDISSEIWKMFGKDRRSYISRDVFSDDEDMEADATILEQEEKMSARIAKKEEMLALEDERRHEEEKRQRKKEKERAMARGR